MNLFFICNQPNYARWTSKYYDNLVKIAETHPDLFEEFQKGFFGIQRTYKNFSKQPIDLVLDQTINADAARKLTGIIQITNSISARRRWALSHDIRSTIISYVYKDLDLQIEQDVTAELTNHNIKITSSNYKHSLIALINLSIHLTLKYLKICVLINISSGKAASETVEKFLLNIEEHGNRVRYIDITKVYEHLGCSLSRYLPRFHPITGCDYNPAFFKKGKQKPFNILKKNEEYLETFMKFGDPDLFRDLELEKNVFNKIQKFICEAYNVPGMIDVDAARFQLFINTYMVSDVNEEFIRMNVKTFDASNLPPCKSELLQQFRRANYITSLWSIAHMKAICIFSPKNNGWTFKDNQYHFNWFDGDQLLAFVSESLQDESEVDIKDADEDNEDIQYQHWIDDELSIFNDDDNED
ncbi:uncharacterized protein TNCV_681281 [Trichonephila clavipes]|nr:uncharacterized protein TNCV_681281 [Trichonephila clavipes]